MAIKKILVPVDASDGAKRALKLAADVAAPNPETTVEVLYVVPIPLLDESQMTSFKEILDMMESDGEDLLAEAKESLDALGDRVTTLIVTGVNPATEIIKLIDEGDYSMVVIGSRGLSGLKEYIGSVSHKVIHGSKVPVLVAK